MPAANPNIASRRELLTSVQAGRAIAAMLVAFYHAGVYIFALDKYWGYDPTRHFFDFGRAGVEFFFVLSGFIILYIHQHDVGEPSRFFRYATKRFLRIYPIYWVILAAVICVYFIVPSFGYPYQREAGTILSSILLVHINGNSNTELAAAWTLYHEILFYSLFSLIILHKRFGWSIIAAWLFVSASTLLIEPAAYPLQFLFSPLHLLFGMGMLSCWALNRRYIPAPRTIALLGTAIFIAAGMEENYVWWLDGMVRNVIYGVGSALILVGVVQLEREGRIRIPSWLLLAGNASYVTYLINFTVLSLMAKVFVHAGAKEMLPPLISYFILSILSIIAGIMVYLWIERPLMRFLKSRFAPRKSAYAATPA
jgi:exopolysaccharide production protein ExoZ